MPLRNVAAMVQARRWAEKGHCDADRPGDHARVRGRAAAGGELDRCCYATGRGHSGHDRPQARARRARRGGTRRAAGARAGPGLAAVASLLGLDDLPCTITDPARLAFDYIARLAAGPQYDRPRLLWDCPACRQTIADHGPGRTPAVSQQGHASGCGRLAADVAEWEQQAQR
jgi:hypothetical protein